MQAPKESGERQGWKLTEEEDASKCITDTLGKSDHKKSSPKENFLWSILVVLYLTKRKEHNKLGIKRIQIN